MTIEAQLPTLEQSKRLKELGWKPNKVNFAWQIPFSREGEAYIINWNGAPDSELPNKGKGVIPTPTVPEMGGWLPVYVEGDGEAKETYTLEITKGIEGYFCGYRNLAGWLQVYSSNQFAVAMADLLIWLAENGYVDFKK